MIKVKFYAIGAELVVAVQHQDVLDNQTIGLAIILEGANLVCPGRSPVSNLDVLIGAANQLAPAGLIQTKDQVSILVLVSSLHSSGIAVKNRVVINADAEAGLLGLFLQVVHALDRVGVGVNADGVARIVLSRSGNRNQRQNHGQSQSEGNELLHEKSLLINLDPYFGIREIIALSGEEGKAFC